MTQFVNAAPHPLTLSDGRVVGAAEPFDADPDDYTAGLVAAGLAIEADEPDDKPRKPAARRREDQT